MSVLRGRVWLSSVENWVRGSVGEVGVKAIIGGHGRNLSCGWR
jgi:hypothetical protein